jgi:hypothetical protein
VYRRPMADWTDSLQVFCADIGSIAQEHFAWARRIPSSDDEEVHTPGNIESLARAVVYQLKQEHPVALGFEMPLFVPVPVESSRLGKARPCDVNAPSWSSGPGGAVLATGLAQVPWLMRYIREQVPDAALHLQWTPFAAQRSGLLLWEAFVTGAAKGPTHEEDARIGMEAFCAQLPTPGDANADETERPFSLVAAAALWAGWDLPSRELRSACVLVRA